MKTLTFLFWISLLVLFPHGLFSKSLTNKEQYSIDSENSNENSVVNGEDQEVALHETFRPRHKYKANNGHRTRFYRSDSETGDKDQDVKAPHCAVMYKDDEPVGILQPYKESYRFLPISGDPTLVDINPIPVKRKTITDVLYPNKVNEDYNEEMVDNTNQFADDRYPSIFAKFKIDSRLDKTFNPDLNMKRSMYKRDTEKPEISDEQVNSLKTTLSKMNGDNSAIVEEELKNILDDMGLIDDYDNRGEAKREVAEDENLEQGTNKINLIKEEHNDTRNKRGDLNDTTGDLQNIMEPIPAQPQPLSTTQSTTNPVTTVAVPTKVQFGEEATEDMESIDLFKDGDAKLNEDSDKNLDVSTEDELRESRKKRQFETDKEVEKADKRDATDTLPDINLNSSSLVTEGELSQYEKRVEREIRDKIQKLKEEVKEEIKILQKNGKDSDTRRRKRQVMNTLMDEETQDIDPNFNDEQHEEHHVRRKRNLLFEDISALRESGIDKNITYPSKLNDERNVKLRDSNINKNTSGVTNSEVSKTARFEDHNENKDGLRIIINIGETYPKIDKIGISDSVEKRNKPNLTEKKNIDDKDALNVTSEAYNTEKTDLETPTSLNLKSLADTEKDLNTSIPLDVINNVTLTNNFKDVKCGDKKDIQSQNKNALTPKIKRDKFHRIRPKTNNSEKAKSTNTSGESKRKNIINVLNVIGEKKHNLNGNNSHVDNYIRNSWSNSRIFLKHHDNAYAEKNVSDVHKLELSPSSAIKTSELNHATDRDKMTIDYNKAALKLYDDKTVDIIGNIGKSKRFIGINPILENITKSTDYKGESLKQFLENGVKIFSNHGKIVSDIDLKKLKETNTIQKNTTRGTDYYHSRSLKQFDEDTIKANLTKGVHIRVKRSIGQGEEAKNNFNNILNRRDKRRSKENVEEKDYQYDNPELNENAAMENQAYDNQPYADENMVAENAGSNAFTSNANSNCNCDKTGSGCKCGTQKTSLNVPNIKEDYSDYDVENPNVVEKKSVNHCNCDKNGKHCKCQTFNEDSEYNDYEEEEEPSGIDKSANLDEEGVLDELRSGVERAPRRPRQGRKKSAEAIEGSKSENIAEDYENYEIGTGKLMKRETGLGKVEDKQQFQNGEYFVDLHPNIYRLTPVDTVREKRDNFKNLVAIHGGGPAMSHLVAIRQRSMLPHSRFRRRVQNDDNKEPRQLIDMSDEDIFGALPQSFAGELARYKRVKRGKTEK